MNNSRNKLVRIEKLPDIDEEVKKKYLKAIDKLIRKYEGLEENSQHPSWTNGYWTGVCDGLNHAYKLLMKIDDDYNAKTKRK